MNGNPSVAIRPRKKWTPPIRRRASLWRLAPAPNQGSVERIRGLGFFIPEKASTLHFIGGAADRWWDHVWRSGIGEQ